MKELIRSTAILFIFFSLLHSAGLQAQAIDPNKSARAAARNDAEFIAENIRDNEDVVFLAQKAVDKGTDTRVKELAQLILDDHTQMLYAMEQLETAGKGASKDDPARGSQERAAAAVINEKLDAARRSDFDSVWVESLIPVHEAKYAELTAAKESAMNTQLKMAISQSLPLLRKHLTQLKSVQKYLIKIATQKRKEEAARAREGK